MTRLFAHTHDADLDEPQIVELVGQIRKIGLARFVGRINSGMIDPQDGYRAVEQFARGERKRPLLSRLSHLFADHPDPLTSDSRSWL